MSFGAGREQTQQAARWTSALGAALPGGQALTRGRRVCGEVLVLFVICTLDMLSSAWLFHHGLAVEGNPVLRGFAEAGIGPFMTAKLATFLPALVVAEQYRRQRPRRARWLLRSTITIYVGIYALAVGGQFMG